ncbi:hypothetical protein CAFE_28220 [Caprobacter fermentans]|uniref:DUF4367 domain-containing protein n=1 Tax=Caproicibacter fermentans TaxID=2576756 RepID=A0A6N8I1V5_9FIRM|nr:DUF4367 domain-containing protein [Caproicibacter fermentans]MVB12091.1 hypothetical protein [Caproicibacter fermentans]OCN02265.1 hypothetical protein A7X67_06355 [Clostridium sp. W14A]
MASLNTDVREKLYEEYEDSLFRLVMYSAAEKEGKLLLGKKAALQGDSSNQPSAEVIKRFEQKLATYRKKSNAPKRKRIFHSIINKAAIFFLVLILTFSTAMVTAQAFRVKVMNFLIDIQSEYTSFQIKDNAAGSNGEKLTVNWTNTYLPTYIPVGYEVDSLTYTEPLKEITYSNPKNKNAYVYFTEYDSSNNLQVDTENAAVVKTVSVNGNKGTLIIKNSLTTIVWKMDRNIFTIQSTENEARTMKIAQNVKFIQ